MATDCVSNPTLMSPSKNIRVGSPCKYVPLEKWVHNSSADINFFAVRERRKEGREGGRGRSEGDGHRVKNWPVRSSFVYPGLTGFLAQV